MYCNRNGGEKNAYILFTSSLTRAIHLELLPDQTADEFIKALKRLMARSGCPETIYSDNAKVYLVASKWIKKINKSKILHNLLALDVSSGNSVLVEHLGAVDDLRECSVW